MTDAGSKSARRQTGRTGSSPATVGTERDDAVTQLASALRTAERAHRAYVAELRLADVEPAEDWSTWYAEYLLAGLRDG